MCNVTSKCHILLIAVLKDASIAVLSSADILYDRPVAVMGPISDANFIKF